MNRSRVIAVRSDSIGDVLVTGPAIRAIAAAHDVTLLCGPRGVEAAHMLTGPSEVICAELPWIDPQPKPVDRADVEALVARLAMVGARAAVIFTSFHQSPLPLALLLRMAGVRRIAAVSEDYPGSLLDVRHRDPGDVHEVERALSLASAAGFELPAGDDGRLRVLDCGPSPAATRELGPYVVIHPGASVPARMWPAQRSRALVELLSRAGRPVVVTGGRDEVALARRVAGTEAVNLAGRLSLRQLAAVIRDADVLVAANTGPAHLAAAVGTPVVSLFSPVVGAVRWRPWRVPQVLLGDQFAACAGTRARECPVAGHPCLASVTAEQVMRAVDRLRDRAPAAAGAVA